MDHSKRLTLLGLGLGAATLTWFGRRAFAETTTYLYDVHGRLVRARYQNGSATTYCYDNAGNRTQVVRTSSLPSPFNQTIAITGTGAVNLRTLANTAGYTGAQDATIIFQVGSGVTISGAAGTSLSTNGGIAIDTGTWPGCGYLVSLTLQISGKVFGGGGAGGRGASGLLAGSSGGAGGDALYCRVPLTLVVNSGGELRAGGGGAGGGASWVNGLNASGGGGGGGGFPNGAAGAGGTGLPLGDPQDGATGNGGTQSSGGAGGAGGVTQPGTRVPGAGGNGGGAAANGTAGGSGSGSISGGWTKKAQGGGGLAGYAVRKNAQAVQVTNNGVISGTVG